MDLPFQELALSVNSPDNSLTKINPVYNYGLLSKGHCADRAELEGGGANERAASPQCV